MSKSCVVDTNIIFSALIPESSSIRDNLLESNHIFYCPNFVITELFKHKHKILKHTKLNEVDFYTYFNGIIENISFVPIETISAKSRNAAFELCKDIDVCDTPFVALAIELHLSLWTGDKVLREGLSKKGFTDFFIP